MSEDPYRKTEGVLSEGRVLKNLVNIGIFVAEVLLLIFAGPAVIKFFFPVLVGWILAQMANPLVKFLEKRLHIVRKHSSFGIIIGALLLIVFACYHLVRWLVRETGDLLGHLPDYYKALIQGIDKISENLEGISSRIPMDMREDITEVTDALVAGLGQIVSGIGGGTVEVAGNVAKNVPSLLVSFIFVLLFAYFFIAQRERVQKIAGHLLPKELSGHLHMIWDKMKYALGGYFRAQFKIMGIVALILAAGFLIMKIDYAVLLAALIALLDFLPMLGTGTALIPWAVFCALSDAVPMAVGLLVLYGVTQVTRQLIQPKMVGDSIGVDTLTTLFFLFIGYRIKGILGMIIAVPVGLILIQLYEAGAFRHVVQNMKELVETVHKWRYRE